MLIVKLMEFPSLNFKSLFALIFSVIALIFYTPGQEIAFENRKEVKTWALIQK